MMERIIRWLQEKVGETSNNEEEKAFERLKKEFPGRDVSLDKMRCSWRDKPVYRAYTSGYGDKLYENSTMITHGISKDHFTADEAVDALIKIRREEKKRRIKEEGI